MTRDRARLVKRALEILVIVEDHKGDDLLAAEDIVDLLSRWDCETLERCARVCEHLAKEWRDVSALNPTESAKALRERSAEACDMAAHRIAPWLYGAVPSPGLPSEDK